MSKAKSEASGLGVFDGHLKDAEDQVRAQYPNFAAAVDAYRAAGHEKPPRIIRITAKEDGFRRGGMAHSGTVDHPVEKFAATEQLEQLFSEPKLKVELIEAVPATEKPAKRDEDPQQGS